MIHSTAIIDPAAELAEDVEVGPYTVIGADVQIGAGTVIGPHAVIKGPTTLGRNNQIFQFASVGEACQDKKYKGEPTTLEVGDENIIREGVTLHRGTPGDRGVTTIGHRNLFMAYAHVAHDCVVGDDCVFANHAATAGHVHMGDSVVLAGFAGIHQFCRVGSYTMVSMYSAVKMDVPAYMMVQGYPASARGLNVEGMRRREYPRETIRALRRAYRLLYRSELRVSEALEQIEPLAQEHPEVRLFVDSITAGNRGIVR
jgi:UDP-N-acetylglucosamine acyltransferase